MNILLDYVFPISEIVPTPEANTAFLKQVCVVAKPKDGGVELGVAVLCTSMDDVADLTNNTESQQLFDAGLSRIYVLPMNDLDLADALEGQNDFFTILISSDFVDADINAVVLTPGVKASKEIGDLTFTAVTAGDEGNSITIQLEDDLVEAEAVIVVDGTDILIKMQDGGTTAETIANAINDSVSARALVTVLIASGQEDEAQDAIGPTALEDGADADTDNGTGVILGTFKGVLGVQSQDEETAAAHAIVGRRCAFFTASANKAKNLFFAFGSLLSNVTNWLNQQYIEMPVDDDVDTLGEANDLFESRISFVLTDDEFGKRLALFAAGGRAIVAPYILKNLQIDLQSAALNYISGNQPAYTIKEATLLENRLQQDVVNSYIARGWITAGIVSVTLVNDNFVANGSINVAEPKALWRVASEMRETL